ncbi:hypothetical protein ACTFIR_009960 [Dictyostelium discoideum]
MVGLHYQHRFEKIGDFQDICNQKNRDAILEESNKIFNHIETNFNNNVKSTIDKFSSFRKVLESLQEDILKQLSNSFNENVINKTQIDSLVHDILVTDKNEVLAITLTNSY